MWRHDGLVTRGHVAQTVEWARVTWHAGTPYQRLCYVVGLLLILIGLIHGLLFLLVGGSWLGPVAWRKPFAFGLSFGLTTMTLAWITTQQRPLPAPWGGPMLGGLAMASIVEVTWVTVQRARGVPSHFNDASSLDRALFVAGGSAVAVIVAVILAVTIRSFIAADTSPQMALAIRVALLVLLVSQAVGGLMIASGLATADANGVASIGSMKIPHAIGMHAIQVLPLLSSLFARTGLARRQRLRAVALASAGYTGLVVAALTPVFAGSVSLPLPRPTGVLLLAALIAAGTAFLISLLALVRSSSPQAT